MLSAEMNIHDDIHDEYSDECSAEVNIDHLNKEVVINSQEAAKLRHLKNWKTTSSSTKSQPYQTSPTKLKGNP